MSTGGHTYTLADWVRPECIWEPFSVIVDTFDDEESLNPVYTGSTLYAYDGDGGRLLISACSEGSILSMRLHECAFIGECDLMLADLQDWIDDLMIHIEWMNKPQGWAQ